MMATFSVELLGFFEDWHVEMKCVEPEGEVFALVVDLFAGRAESEDVLWDVLMAVVVEIDVDALGRVEDHVVNDVSHIRWKPEKMTFSHRVLFWTLHRAGFWTLHRAGFRVVLAGIEEQ